MANDNSWTIDTVPQAFWDRIEGAGGDVRKFKESLAPFAQDELREIVAQFDGLSKTLVLSGFRRFPEDVREDLTETLEESASWVITQGRAFYQDVLEHPEKFPRRTQIRRPIFLGAVIEAVRAAVRAMAGLAPLPSGGVNVMGETTSTAHERLRDALAACRTVRDLGLRDSDLRGLQLAGLRADGLDLAECDLRDSTLTRVAWRGCTLRNARLDAADFSDAVLRICDLDDVRATGTRFVRARLENSSARGARLDAADFSSAVLTDTDLSRASLRGARLDGVSATGVDLRGSDLRGASLRNAVLIDADLRGADLTDADLHDANLNGADLRGVVGLDAARLAASAASDVAPALQDSSETMAPIVAEVLRTAGRSGAIDADTAQRLIDEAARHQTAPPQHAPSPETLAAVSRVIAELGDAVLPILTSALRQPNQAEPPKEVQDVIRRLRQELSLDEGATTEDLLHRLTHGARRG